LRYILLDIIKDINIYNIYNLQFKLSIYLKLKIGLLIYFDFYTTPLLYTSFLSKIKR